MKTRFTKVPCPLCGQSQFSTIYPDSESRIVQCQGCDLVFFNPLPTVEYLADFYSSETGYLPSIEENLRSFEEDPERWREPADAVLHSLRELGMQQGARILDVGCAYGFFLQEAKRQGYDVHGLEISAETSAWARQQGLDVRTGHLGEAPFEPGSIDALTLNNVLEHSIQPVDDLRSARRLLADGGLIYIAVPNWRSTVAQTDKFYWKMKSWPNHLFYFEEKTLGEALRLAGFEPVASFSHIGHSAVEDDLRVLKAKLDLHDEAHVEAVRRLMAELGYAQELVMIAKAI